MNFSGRITTLKDKTSFVELLNKLLEILAFCRHDINFLSYVPVSYMRFNRVEGS